jgi:hypothetical protein
MVVGNRIVLKQERGLTKEKQYTKQYKTYNTQSRKQKYKTKNRKRNIKKHYLKMTKRSK